jgi:hypothetical protein
MEKSLNILLVSTQNSLMGHLGDIHFKDDLAKLYAFNEDDETRCNLCQKKLKTKFELIVHLVGGGHNLLAGIITENDKNKMKLQF